MIKGLQKVIAPQEIKLLKHCKEIEEYATDDLLQVQP